MSSNRLDNTDRPKILFIDDEVNVLNALQRLLRQEGFEIVTSHSPFEALHLLTQQSFAVLVSDYKMPLMLGSELLEKAREISPKTIRILLTAHADVQISIEAINRGGVYKLLTKPWQDEEFKITLRQAVSQYELVHSPAVSTMAGQSPETQTNNELRDLAGKVMAGVHNMYQVDQALENNRRGSLKALAKIIQMHSKVIWEHAHRVYTLCDAMACEAHLNPTDKYTLEIAALFHDIGLVSVPAGILKKNPNTLVPDEKALYQSHAMQGETLLAMIPGMEGASAIIRQHHEQFDGNGYPDRIRGDKIPLGARILAIADFYDELQVMLSGQKAISPKLAVQIVESQSGIKFDPALIPVFHRALTRLASGQAPNPKSMQNGLGWMELLGDLSRVSDKLEDSSLSAAQPQPTSPEPEVLPETTVNAKACEDSEPPESPPGEHKRMVLDPLLMALPGSDYAAGMRGQSGKLITRINLADIRVGMVLAEDICTRSQSKLLSRDTVITQQLLGRILNFMDRDDVSKTITVYRERYVPSTQKR